VTLNRSHDDGVEVHRDSAVTAETHTAPEEVLGFVGHSSAEAHVAPVETSNATRKDIAEDTSSSSLRYTVPSKDQHSAYAVRTRGTNSAGDPFHRNTGGGASKEQHIYTDSARQRTLTDSSKDTAMI